MIFSAVMAEKDDVFKVCGDAIDMDAAVFFKVVDDD
jgi:hypothetical protein